MNTDVVISITGREKGNFIDAQGRRAKGRRVVVSSTLMDEDDAMCLPSRVNINDAGYACVYTPEQVLLHRWILKIDDPKIPIDHIDGNTLNNTKRNLRVADSQIQTANSVRENRYGRGVRKVKNRYYASGSKNGIDAYLPGGYDTPQEAAQAAHEWRLENLPGYYGRGYDADTTV